MRYTVSKQLLRCITTAFTTDVSAYSSVSCAVTPLNAYGLLKITGKDSSSFLQGLVTNDITAYSNTYNAILTPNGRYLYDCFVSQFNDSYLIETDINIIPDLIKYFKKYKLRSKVEFENISDEYRIWSVLAPPKSIEATYLGIANKYRCYIDPRYNAMGIRIILNKNEIPHHVTDNCAPIGQDFYYALKCVYGIPTHGIDLISNKSIILESNLNYLNGVSFNKGCYVGQELIARTHHRGEIRKRLFGATIINKEIKGELNMFYNNCHDDRDSIFPAHSIPIQSTEYDYKNRDIIDVQSNNVVGKITSQENGLNCCILQLRNTAFVDINNNEAKTVELEIAGTDYSVIPHYTDYFESFCKLFGKKE